eukprot:scaffold79_cov259-Pinguiococcus_pyrenoidosus.AAC.40
MQDLLLFHVARERAEHLAQHAVVPHMGILVEAAEQVVDADALGKDRDDVLRKTVDLLQQLEHRRLARTGPAQEKQPVADLDHRAEEIQLLSQRRRGRDAQCPASAQEGVVRHPGMARLHLLVSAGEHAAFQPGVVGNILRRQFGHVDHMHRVANDRGALCVRQRALLRVLCSLAQIAADPKHRLQRSHPEVVVPLGAQLLGTKLQEADALPRELGDDVLREVADVERDGGDLEVVGLHHGAGTEERLEVAGQLGAAGVAGVERDEDVEVQANGDAGALEGHAGEARLLGLCEHHHLLRHDAEHAGLQAIELVEAAPVAAARQALEELCHGHVVQPLRRVEHDAANRDGFAQVLHRLRLSRAGGPLRSAAVERVDRQHHGMVAALGERRNHQSTAVPKVLVLVVELHADDADEHVPALSDVVLQSALPRKVGAAPGAGLDQVRHDVAVVERLGQHRVDPEPLEQSERLAPSLLLAAGATGHKPRQAPQAFAVLVAEGFQGLLRNRFLRASGEAQLRRGDDRLRRALVAGRQPQVKGRPFGERSQRSLDVFADRLRDGRLQRLKPVFNLSGNLHLLQQVEPFSLLGDRRRDNRRGGFRLLLRAFLDLSDIHGADALKELLQVPLDEIRRPMGSVFRVGIDGLGHRLRYRIAIGGLVLGVVAARGLRGVAKQLQQLGVGQEVETRERRALLPDEVADVAVDLGQLRMVFAAAMRRRM